MQIREYSLPNGWFPRDPGLVREFLSGFSSLENGTRAVIAPHAGWFYCGKIAARSISSLKQTADTVVVLGGHLSASSAPLFAMEEAVKTPFGHIPIDSEFRSSLKKELNGSEDRYRDNTIEVLLPMVHHYFPESYLIWLRLPASLKSFESGKIISKLAKTMTRKVNIIASTDLTHYGPNYGFTPQGIGHKALRWVREVNDANFIKAVESGNCAEVLRRAEQDCAACSVGAVLGAMGFADAEGLGSPLLLEYGTSAEIENTYADSSPPDSFVGYAAMGWQQKCK